MGKRITLATACLAALASVALLSCGKGSSSGSSSSSATSLLTSSRWTFTGYEYQQKSGTWIPDPNAASANRFTIGFSSSGTTSEIDLVNGYTTTGGWSMSSNGTVLTATGGYDLLPAAYNVTALTSSSLQLTNPAYVTTAYSAERLNFTH